MSQSNNEEILWQAIEENIDKRLKSIQEHNQEMLETYPPDVPNEAGNHAIISGVLINNAVGRRVGEYTPLLKTQHEEVFIWTHTKNQQSSLISKVSQDIKNESYWKSFGHVLELALNYADRFESKHETEYHWVYYFDNNSPIEEHMIEYVDHANEKIHSGVWKNLASFKYLSSLLDLLLTDEVFYASVNMFNNSIDIHWFCIICELFEPPVNKHPSHEPENWQHANLIPKMEASIVQSCRTVEAILGKPGNRESPNKVHKMKEKWKELIKIDPDDMYEKAGMSYLDYYYKLFEFRNDSAHSFGKISFNLSRELTITAQSFAFLIMDAYLEKHMLDRENASERLQLNQDIIEQEPNLYHAETLD